MGRIALGSVAGYLAAVEGRIVLYSRCSLRVRLNRSASEQVLLIEDGGIKTFFRREVLRVTPDS